MINTPHRIINSPPAVKISLLQYLFLLSRENTFYLVYVMYAFHNAISYLRGETVYRPILACREMNTLC